MSRRGLVGALILGLCPSSLAWANEPLDPREKVAIAHRDAGAYTECARAYLDIHEDAASPHPRPDWLLWCAADCYASAGEMEQRWAVARRLIDDHPDSELAHDYLAAFGDHEAAIGHFAEASEFYERYAEHFPDADHGVPALQNAYLLRLGLGHEQAASADLDALERIYEEAGAGARESRSDLFWTRRDLLATSKQRRAHAVEYLDDYAGAGPPAREVVAEVVIAQIDWRASCREPLLLDSCVSVSRVKSPTLRNRSPDKYRPPKRCGGSTATSITVHPRNRKLADAAQERLVRATRLAAKIDEHDFGVTDVAGKAEFTRAWAAAEFYRTEPRYEEYLRLTLPDKLDFTVERWRRDSGIPDWERKYAEQIRTSERSRYRLGEYLEHQRKLGEALQQGYLKAREIGDIGWTVAGVYRSGAALRFSAEQLIHAEVPASLRSEVEVNAYCNALAEAAQPLAEQARGAWLYCVERSTQSSYFDEFSWACEAELERLYPGALPANRELFGEADYLGPAVKSAGLIADPSAYID